MLFRLFIFALYTNEPNVILYWQFVTTINQSFQNHIGCYICICIKTIIRFQHQLFDGILMGSSAFTLIAKGYPVLYVFSSPIEFQKKMFLIYITALVKHTGTRAVQI